ncbi:MAG: hypothetical protein RR515_00585, partial [Clostridium sp.]
YWEEDYIEIPRDVHRNMSYYLDETNISKNDFLEDALVKGRDPYSLILRLEIAERYKSKDKYKEALMEYSNALYCCDDNEICKDILKEALYCCREGGIIYLIKIIEQDIRLLR